MDRQAIVVWSSFRRVNTAERCFRFFRPDDAPLTQEALTPAIAGTGIYEDEFRVLWPDGRYHWLFGKGQSAFHDASGKPTHVVGVNIDITERKQIEAALLQNEKLAAAGRLSASIAREIDNPL